MNNLIVEAGILHLELDQVEYANGNWIYPTTDYNRGYFDVVRVSRPLRVNCDCKPRGYCGKKISLKKGDIIEKTHLGDARTLVTYKITRE